MRENKYRGWSVEQQRWVYGSLLGKQSIIVDYDTWQNLPEPPYNYLLKTERYLVEPESVGQYMGLVDKNGVEVYLGDIVLIHTGYKFDDADAENTVYKGLVDWSDEECCVVVRTQNRKGEKCAFKISGRYWFGAIRGELLEVIETQYENPEMP